MSRPLTEIKRNSRLPLQLMTKRCTKEKKSRSWQITLTRMEVKLC